MGAHGAMGPMSPMGPIWGPWAPMAPFEPTPVINKHVRSFAVHITARLFRII